MSGKLASGNLKEWDPNISFQYSMKLNEDVVKLVEQGKLNVTQNDEPDIKKKIQRIIQSKKILLGQNVIITHVWTYKTPLSEKQWTAWMFYHQYVIIQLRVNNTQIIFATLQKNGERIWIMKCDAFSYAKDHTPVDVDRVQKRLKSTYWEPINLLTFQVECDYFKLLQFLYSSQENKKTYNLFNSNCQVFSQKIVTFLRMYKVK